MTVIHHGDGVHSVATQSDPRDAANVRGSGPEERTLMDETQVTASNRSVDERIAELQAEIDRLRAELTTDEVTFTVDCCTFTVDSDSITSTCTATGDAGYVDVPSSAVPAFIDALYRVHGRDASVAERLGETKA